MRSLPDENQQRLWDRSSLPPGPDSMAARFWAFHLENPHIYDKLVELALDLHTRGVKGYGMASLFEVLRWHHAMSTSDEEFKLNNNYRAFYARLIMKSVPRLKGFFTTRDSVADEET